MAGNPASICSDRGEAFVDCVIQQLVEFFGITHVIGSAYHPQSQGAVERMHREYNFLRKAFMNDRRD